MQREKHYHTPIARLTICIVVLALLLSACSGAGSSSGTGPALTTKKATPTATTSHSQPVAGQPPATHNLPPGKTLPANEIKPLTFMLAYNDAAMEQDVAQIYTPGSPTFHQFLTPAQVLQRYALSDAQQQTVLTWLNQHGYIVISTDPLHTSITVQATVSTIERTLNIKLHAYTFGKYQFFMQDGNPTLPAPVNALVASVIGLDNFAIPTFKPPFGLNAQGQQFQTSSSAACSGYGAQQTLTRDKLAAAYSANALYAQGLQGQGMTIGVAEFGDSYNPQDIAQYAACAGISAPNIQNIDVDGHLAAAPGQGEAALDLELIAGLAPKAHILDYQADLSNTSFAQALVDVFNRVATDDKVQVLSVSYGTYEDSFSASEQAAVNRSLRTLAAEGISTFISSGDCGAFSTRIRNIAMVSFPASAPYSIAVGGTHLQVNTNNVRTSETAWGPDNNPLLCANDWGSGGGVSENGSFKRSSWQVGPGTTTAYNGKNGLVFENLFTLTFASAPNGLRQVPDVAAAAYPNIAMYYKGAWHMSGGTSAAAPIWAAGALLVDQGLQQKGKPSLGGVPGFYTLANHPGHFHPYTDITSGNNGFYKATPGWDYVTGWGSPNFNDILQLELSQ